MVNINPSIPGITLYRWLLNTPVALIRLSVLIRGRIHQDELPVDFMATLVHI
jgi:hypothetical protein